MTAHLLLFGVVLVWGVTFALVKAALVQVTPLLFNLLRMTLAFAVLLAANVSTLRGLTARDLRLGAIAGTFLAAGYQFQTTGLEYTTASKYAFITGLVVVLVPLLSALPGVRPRPAGSSAHGPASGTDARSTVGLDGSLGAALAFTGLVELTTVPGSGRALLSGLGRGEWLTLVCALAYAAHLLTLARITPQKGETALHTARRLGTLQIGFAMLGMWITLPLGGRPHFHSSPVVWIALATTALFATAAAFTIQSWAQQHMPATHAALIFTLEPVFAWLTSLLFLGERLGARALVGASLILAGILFSEMKVCATISQKLRFS